METPKALPLTPQQILSRPYERVLIPEEEGGFSAYIAEFEGCMAQGETADEALNRLYETAIVWIEAELEEGKEIPEPWNLQQFSGKFLLRLPKSLHQQVAKLADKEGVSLNQYLVSKIAATTREDSLLAALEQRIKEHWLEEWRQTGFRTLSVHTRVASTAATITTGTAMPGAYWGSALPVVTQGKGGGLPWQK